MENGSKALIIAGSVLIAVLIISLLVAFYDDLRALMTAEEDIVVSEQALEFNKQFDVYYRNNVYGSELLSLTNKVVDYNVKYGVTDYDTNYIDANGYSKLDLQVTFVSNIYANGETIFKIGETYNAEKLSKKIATIEKNIDTIGKKSTVTGKKIHEIAGFRDNQLEELLKDKYNRDEIDDELRYKFNEIKQNINKYNGYTSLLKNLKAATFSATEFEYNDQNARIVLMKFQQND